MEYQKINGLYERYGVNNEPIPDGKKKGDFKEGIFSCPEFEYLQYNTWIWKDKLDGTNIRIYIEKDTIKIMGKGDNSNIPTPLLDWIKNWYEENKSNIHNLNEGTILYCEGVGKKIQKAGINYGNQQHIRVFDININNYWLEQPNIISIAESINLHFAEVILQSSIPEAIKMIQNDNQLIEGLVGKPEIRLNDIHSNQIITKLKKVDFQIKNKE